MALTERRGAQGGTARGERGGQSRGQSIIKEGQRMREGPGIREGQGMKQGSEYEAKAGREKGISG
jgi:hypothetical protein